MNSRFATGAIYTNLLLAFASLFAGGFAFADTPNVITVIIARQRCLDIQPPGNMTGLVEQAWNGRTTCSYQSPGQQPNSATRTFCTQHSQGFLCCRCIGDLFDADPKESTLRCWSARISAGPASTTLQPSIGYGV